MKRESRGTTWPGGVVHRPQVLVTVTETRGPKVLAFSIIQVKSDSFCFFQARHAQSNTA